MAETPYVASTLSFLPRNIASLHQPDMFPAGVTGPGGSTPIRDEEGGSTPVLDEPDDDDINYGDPMVMSGEGKTSSSGGQQPANAEFAYRFVQMNDGMVAAPQLPDENGTLAATAPGVFSPDGNVVYRSEVVDGFQSASEAFHPPPDFFHPETNFSVPPPMTVYQVQGEGFGHASDSLPMLSSSSRDVVYTVVTTIQQTAPTSFYPVVIEVPTFTEPPPKLSTFPTPAVSFVHPPPAVFNPNLPPPTLPSANLPPPPSLAPAQPVSLQYTIPQPASIQVIEPPPHTLRSPLPAPPKAEGSLPVYARRQSTSNLLMVPTVPPSHSSDDDKTPTSYKPESVLRGIRHLRDIQEKDSNVVSVIPTIGTSSGAGRSQQTLQKSTPQKSPVAVRQVPSLMSLRQPEEIARKFRQKSLNDAAPALFAGGKRRLSGSVSDDSVSVPEAEKLVRDDAESELDDSVPADDDTFGVVANDEVAEEEIGDDAGDNVDFTEDITEVVNPIPCLPLNDRRSRPTGFRLFDMGSDTGNKFAQNSVGVANQMPRLPRTPGGHRTPFRIRSVAGGGPRSFGQRRGIMTSFLQPRVPRIPRMPRPLFRGGPRHFWRGVQ